MCDGAAPSCAVKMATAAEAALRSARMALDGIPLTPGRGIACDTAEAALRRVAALGAGMAQSDRRLFETLRAEAERMLPRSSSPGRGREV